MLAKRADNDIWIAPSLLSADFAHLADQIQLIEQAGAALLHLDVMDGHFSPNLTIGPPLVKSIRSVTKMPFDAHLMITDPLKFAPHFAKAGADCITFHAETVPDGKSAARQIASLGVSVGVTINPDTPAETIFDVLELVDLVLVMSVYPGFSGQKFIPDTLKKVEALRQRMRSDQWLQIDGGISTTTVGRAAAAGANCFVAGSAVFGADDPTKAVQEIKSAARSSAI
ncbi:MAG: ribulose-phosphate 3-epimerase [Actinobacteria bacterium]|nr:ribulose-phosphate 3-epimerase [Actinomycetota bacterium]